MRKYLIFLLTLILIGCSNEGNNGSNEYLAEKVRFHCKMNLDKFETILNESKNCVTDKHSLNEVKNFYKTKGNNELKYEFYFCTSCRDISENQQDEFVDRYEKLLFDQKTNELLLKDTLSHQDVQIIYKNTLKIYNLIKEVSDLKLKK